MLKCNDWPISVCSWSLQKDIRNVAESMRKLDIAYIHLAVRPAIGEGGRDGRTLGRKSQAGT